MNQSDQDLTIEFEVTKSSQKWCMGIDEAGRGPVLGPMVYGCTVWRIIDEAEMKSEGFFDSKQLTEEKRELIFTRMKELQNKKLYYEVRILSAEFISNRMLANARDSLNQLSFQAAYSLIDSVLSQGFNLTNVYIDTVGKKETYQANLEYDYKIKAPNVQFVVSEKADSKFPIVGAASICAKVTRDKLIIEEKLREIIPEIEQVLGSGYPSDPATKRWLQEIFDPVFGFPSNVRFSWSTIDNIFAEKGLKVKFYDGQDEDGSGNGKKQTQLMTNVGQQVKKYETKGYNAKKIGISRNFDL